MKESRKEFIKKAHSAACSDWKANIEKEFPKLFKRDGLEIGKWYKYPDVKNWKLLITDNTKNKEKGVGFNCSEIWMKDWSTNGGNELSSLIPCSDKEVEKALIKEAKRRGFKEGVMIKSKWLTAPSKKKLMGNFIFDNEFELCCRASNGSLYTIFQDGEWATIVETITKEQAEKELGKTILN